MLYIVCRWLPWIPASDLSAEIHAQLVVEVEKGYDVHYANYTTAEFNFN